MRPRSADNNISNRSGANAVLRCQRFVTDFLGCVATANRRNVGGLETRRRLSLAERGSFPLNRIGNIFELRTQLKMIGIYAWWIIALMANSQISRQFPVVNQIRKAMRKDRRRSSFCCQSSVSVYVRSISPKPASLSLLYLLPETVGQALRCYTVCSSRVVEAFLAAILFATPNFGRLSTKFNSTDFASDCRHLSRRESTPTIATTKSSLAARLRTFFRAMLTNNGLHTGSIAYVGS